MGCINVYDLVFSPSKKKELADEEHHSDAEDGNVDPADPQLHPNIEVTQTLSCLQKEFEWQAEMGRIEAMSETSCMTKESKAADAVEKTVDVDKDIHNTEADERPPLTLQKILEMNGFDKYEPLHQDSQHAMLARVHKLAPDMLSFVRQMRLGESFLRPGQVQRPKRPLSKWNQLQKDLSEAQRSYGLQGARQGRAASWWGFAKLVAEQAQETALKVNGAPKSDVMLRAPAVFRPSNVLDKDMSRHYQLLVIRLHRVGSNHLAIVCRVFRSSSGKKCVAASLTRKACLLISAWVSSCAA